MSKERKMVKDNSPSERAFIEKPEGVDGVKERAGNTINVQKVYVAKGPYVEQDTAKNTEKHSKSQKQNYKSGAHETVEKPIVPQKNISSNKNRTNNTAEQHPEPPYQGKQDNLDSNKTLSFTRKPTIENTTRSLAELIEKYPLFQSAEEIDFPTKMGGKPRIPHIIHQIYTDKAVIVTYQEFIKTFIDNNPKWEYRFWTYESGGRLIADRHPYLLPTFNKLNKLSIKKSDFIKYAALYEFGGFYADLDVKNYRPLDNVTMKFACIIPPQPFEVASLSFKRSLLLSPAVLMCRPKHPFFKALLENLAGVDPMSYPDDTTGTKYLTAQYLKYNNLTEADLNKPMSDTKGNAPYFYRGTKDVEDDNSIYIPNSQYFNDKVDPRLINEEGNTVSCQKFLSIQHIERLFLLQPVMLRGCVEFENRRKIRKSKKYAYTVHFWHFLWQSTLTQIVSARTMLIEKIVPHVVFY